jgi:hypothetical protein
MISVYQGQSIRFVLKFSLVDHHFRRRRHHDHVPPLIRNRIPKYRLHLFHSFGHQRTHHGRIRNYNLVRFIIMLRKTRSEQRERHIYMVISEVVTLFFYVISIAFLPEYFGACSHCHLPDGLLMLCRPRFCRVHSFCMESSCDRRSQRSSPVYHKAHS